MRLCLCLVVSSFVLRSKFDELAVVVCVRSFVRSFGSVRTWSCSVHQQTMQCVVCHPCRWSPVVGRAWSWCTSAPSAWSFDVMLLRRVDRMLNAGCGENGHTWTTCMCVLFASHIFLRDYFSLHACGVRVRAWVGSLNKNSVPIFSITALFAHDRPPLAPAYNTNQYWSGKLLDCHVD